MSTDSSALKPASLSSYALRLFGVQYNLILVGGAILFSFASASFAPAVAAVAAELLWVGVGSMLPGMRRWVDRRDAAMQRAAMDRALTTPGRGLDAEYVRRVHQLDEALADIRASGGARPDAGFALAVTRLETLRPVYVGLCETHQRVSRFLASNTEANLLAETESLKLTFAAEKDLGTRLTLRQAVALAQRRVEHRQRMANVVRSVTVKLESIERSIAYLKSQGPALTAHAGFVDDVETLLAEVGPGVHVDEQEPDAGRLATA